MEKALLGDVGNIYKVDSDIILANTIYFVQTNPVEAMFGIIKRLKCGEIKFNSDTKDVVTKLYPVGYNGIKLAEKYVNVPNWNSDKYPPFPIVKKIQLKEADNEVTLRAMAKESIKTI